MDHNRSREVIQPSHAILEQIQAKILRLAAKHQLALPQNGDPKKPV
jgi:hypothetical protein